MKYFHSITIVNINTDRFGNGGVKEAKKTAEIKKKQEKIQEKRPFGPQSLPEAQQSRSWPFGPFGKDFALCAVKSG